MFTVLRDSEALAAFGAALPAKIKKLDDQVFAKVLQQLNAFKAKHADAVPFALTMIARRLETPWQLIYLATKTVESKAAAAIAATPYAIVVSMALDQIDEKQLLLRVALRNNRIVIAKGILREIYAIEEAIKSNVELGNSDWGTRLRDTMAAVAAALEAEVERSRASCGNLSHVLESSDLRPAMSLKERLEQAVKKGRDLITEILPA
jgi:predicted transport protein